MATTTTRKRKRANTAAGGGVRPSSRTNPAEPTGTAVERVYTYWRTPRFKKDRAWLEEHLGQQQLFKYNPATVHVQKVPGGFGVMIGNQLIGKPTTAAVAQRRVDAMRKSAAKYAGKKKKKNPTPGQRAAKVAKSMLTAFDVNKDGELNKKDLTKLRKAKRAKKAKGKKNPGILSTLVELAMGASAALDVKRHYDEAGPKKRKPAKKTAKGSVRPSSQKKAPAKRNPATDEVRAFRLFHAKGLDAAVKFVNSTKLPAPRKRSIIAELRTYHKPPTIGNPTKKKPAAAPAKKAVPKRNSAAYADFQGRSSDKTVEISTPPGTPKRVWCLGRLLELRLAGYPDLDFRGKRFYLVANEGNTQLYIGGGRVANASPGLKDGFRVTLGEIKAVIYETEKAHLGDDAGQPSQYIHHFGDEGGNRPVLAADAHGWGYIEGGDYTITTLGIRD